MGKLESTNPAKGYISIGTIEQTSEEAVRETLEQAQQKKDLWRQTPLTERKAAVKKFMDACRSRLDDISSLITQETGKAIRESMSEAEDTIDWMEFMLEEADGMLSEETVFEDENKKDMVVLEPWGVAGVILPWNYPFEMFVWGVVPNVLAGNVVVVKHSEECVLVGKLLADIAAGIPELQDVIYAIHGGPSVGSALVDGDIDLLWFTGSSATGQHLYAKAGEKFIPSVMELGGSSPGIIFEDVDVDSIMDNVFRRRFTHCGQVCSSIKRLLVHESIFEDAVKHLQERVDDIRVGDPTDPGVDHGSLVAKRQLDLLREQLEDAESKGATLYSGSTDDGLEGAYHPFTIITDVTTDMRVWTEEVFGPALVVMPFSDEKQAIRLANDTEYGLTAYVYTADTQRFERVARAVQAGRVAHNGQSSSKCAPFGGYKKSGMGREHSRYGYANICQIKTITVKK